MILGNAHLSQLMEDEQKFLLVSELQRTKHMNMNDLFGFSGEIKNLLQHQNFSPISMD
jgi:hypothetical protein